MMQQQQQLALSRSTVADICSFFLHLFSSSAKLIQPVIKGLAANYVPICQIKYLAKTTAAQIKHLFPSTTLTNEDETIIVEVVEDLQQEQQQKPQNSSSTQPDSPQHQQQHQQEEETDQATIDDPRYHNLDSEDELPPLCTNPVRLIPYSEQNSQDHEDFGMENERDANEIE